MLGGIVEREYHQGRVELREVHVVNFTPYEGVVQVDRKGMGVIEGSAILKTGF